MKELSIQVCKRGDKTPVHGVVLMPDSIEEFRTLLTDEECLKLLQGAYLERAKARLRTGGTGRKRVLKIKLKELSADQRVVLTRLGLLKGD